MAVGASPVGHVALLWVASGQRTMAFPAGTAAGHLAVLYANWPLNWYDESDGPVDREKWVPVREFVWTRVLTDEDVAVGSVTANGRLTSLTILSGARGIKNFASSRGVYISETGGGRFTLGFSDYYESTDKLGVPAAYKLSSAQNALKKQWVAAWWQGPLSKGTQYLERDYDVEAYESWEVLPAKGPNPPLLSKPTGGIHLDYTQEIVLAWVHQSNSGMLQQARKVRVRVVGASTWSYLAADGTLNVAEQTVTTSGEEASVDAGTLSSGALYEWSVSTMDNGTWSDWATAATFTAQARPTVAVTFATVAEDLTPAGSWVPTTPGGAQTAWRAIVLPAATEGVSESVAALVPWQPGTGTNVVADVQEWTNGGAYKLWVQIVQTGGLESVWTASEAQTISWTQPAAPTSVTVTDGSPLTVTVAGILVGAEGLVVEWAPKLADDWDTVKIVLAPGTSETITVPLAPYGVGRRYRARVWNELDGVAIPSAWTTAAAAVASTDRQARLVSADGATSLDVCIQSESDRTLVQGVQVAYGLSGDRDVEPRAMVDATPAAGWRGTLVLLTVTGDERAAVMDWVTAPLAQWWIRWSPETEGETRTLTEVGPLLVTLAGEVTVGRPLDRLAATRLVSIPWVEQ